MKYTSVFFENPEQAKTMSIHEYDNFVIQLQQEAHITPSVIRQVFFKTQLNEEERNVLEYAEEDISKVRTIEGDLYNYLKDKHPLFLGEIEDLFHKAMEKYNPFLPIVQKFLKGKRLYGNTYKGIRIYNKDYTEEKYILTNLSLEKIELVLMFVESLFDKNLNLDELIFYASMFFDIYEMEGTTFREFGESKLENINLSKVKIYKVCLDAIRSRHGSHKELLLHSKLLWENMSLGVRIFRVIYYHAEKFLLDSQKNYQENQVQYTEKIYELNPNKGELDKNVTMSIQVKMLEKQEMNNSTPIMDIAFEVEVWDIEDLKNRGLTINIEPPSEQIDLSAYKECSDQYTEFAIGYKFSPYFNK